MSLPSKDFVRRLLAWGEEPEGEEERERRAGEIISLLTDGRSESERAAILALLDELEAEDGDSPAPAPSVGDASSTSAPATGESPPPPPTHEAVKVAPPPPAPTRSGPGRRSTVEEFGSERDELRRELDRMTEEARGTPLYETAPAGGLVLPAPTGNGSARMRSWRERAKEKRK